MERDLTPEESAKVQEIRAALESEFATNEANTAKQSAIKDITELKQDALASLKHIVKHSQNETLKAKVSMWAYEQILESEAGSNDPLKNLFADMPAPASASPADAT